MAKIKRKVIDVSQYQGKIDWKRVKDAGIEGAIIRVGDGTKTKDKQCDRNIKECERLGIPFGLYIYSRAKTKKQARKEADIVIKKAKGHKIQYPLYIDLEQQGYGKYAKKTAEAFGDRVEQKGYWCGIYANLSWWKDYLKGMNRFSKWVARYGSKPKVANMDMWQYSSAGKVPGISGKCDMDYCYVDFPKLIGKK